METINNEIGANISLKDQSYIFNMEKILRAMAARCGLLSSGVEVIPGQSSVGLVGAGIDVELSYLAKNKKEKIWIIRETYLVDKDNKTETNEPKQLATAGDEAQEFSIDNHQTISEIVDSYSLQDGHYAAHIAILRAVERRIEMSLAEFDEDTDAFFAP